MANSEHMTLAEFRVKFPEFVKAEDTWVESFLEDAVSHVLPSMFGSFTREAHGFRAAHAMAMSPRGRSLQLVETPEAKTSTYEMEFRKIVSKVSPKAIVL